MRDKKGITIIILVITIIILLILVGITLSVLGGENGVLSKTKLAKKKYEISQAKEELEIKIAELMLDKECKGERFKKEDLPKMNDEKIDVGSTEEFPVEIIYDNYKFQIDENYNVIYIGEAESSIITYITEPKGYTNQDKVMILIIAKNEKGIKSIKYPDGDILKCNGKKQVGIDYEVTKNGTYKFNVVDIEDKEIEKDIVIDQIDKLPPLDFTPKVERNGKTIIIKENSQDAEADGISTKSGIDHYEYYLINENNETQKYDTNKIEGITKACKLYVIAYDKAGNSKNSNIIEIEEYILNKPEIMLNTDTWTNQNIIVEVNYGNVNPLFIKEVSIDGGNTYFEYTGTLEIEKNTLIKARIRSGSEFEEAELEIDNIDKLPPLDFTPSVLDNISSTELQINASSTDQISNSDYNSSGIKGYKYYVEKDGNLITSSDIIPNKDWKASDLLDGESYDIYVEVYDNAGNMTKSKAITYTKLEVYIWNRYSAKSKITYSYRKSSYKDVKMRVRLSDLNKYVGYVKSPSSNFNVNTGNWTVGNSLFITKDNIEDIRYRYYVGYAGSAAGSPNYSKTDKFGNSNNSGSKLLYPYEYIEYDSFNKMYKYKMYVYESYSITEYSKGNTLYGTVASNLDNTYPVNGYQNGYWYERQ